MKIEQIEPVYGLDEKIAMAKYLDSDGWLMEHKKTRELEQMICNFTGSKFCHMVPNGTLSLCASLIALGVKPGDEVIVPDYTMIATATAVSFIGAKPVFVDIETKHLGLDIGHLKERITKKTKCIMMVSINGRPPRDWIKILDLSKEKGIPVIEDAAQSFGSYFDIKQSKVHLGTLGDIGSFSFSVPKIITMGGGGAIITDDKEIYHKIKLIKNFGREKGGEDIHLYPGINLKYTDLQSVIGIEQMKKMPYRMKKKKEIYKLYKEQLDGVVRFIDTDLKYTCPWMNDILLKSKEERNDLIAYLKSKEIGTRPFYPAIHSQQAYTVKDTRFYVASDVSRKGLWLPSSLSLTNDDIIYVCDEVKRGMKKY